MYGILLRPRVRTRPRRHRRKTGMLDVSHNRKAVARLDQIINDYVVHMRHHLKQLL
jgi:hypothetical protein